MQFTYSIIIPHYNSVHLLKKLLLSIPERDDIQILIVDDCSCSDEKKQLLELHHLGLKLFFEEKNVGAGNARNVALEKVESKWVLFADADDYFTEHAFDCFDKYKDSNFDFVNFCVTSQNSSTGVFGARKITSDQSVRKFLLNPNRKTEMFLKYKNFALWNKMISSRIIKQYELRCENVQVNNDVKFVFNLAYHSKNIKVIPEELYCCTYTPGSITYKKRSVEREFLFYLQAKKRNGFYHKLGLGSPFIRHDIIYLPYMIKKRGFIEAIKFYRYCWQHRNELKEASKAYLDIFDHEK